ncbi:MAG: DNA repair protein RecO [bacterium]
MSLTTETQAIILERRSMKEYDRRVVVFTKNFGRLDLIAKGTLRLASKLAGSLEPLTETNLNIARGRFDRVIGSVTREAWPRLHNDLEALAAASFLAQVTSQLAQKESPDPAIYNQLQFSLAQLNEIPSDQFTIIVRRYLWQLFDHLGFKPQLSKCVRCGKSESIKYTYVSEAGGAVCEQCQTAGSKGIALTANTVEALNSLLNNKTDATPANKTTDRTIAQIIDQTLLIHTQKHLPTDSFWRSINRFINQ